jgi:hypothetical protein
MSKSCLLTPDISAHIHLSSAHRQGEQHSYRTHDEFNSTLSGRLLRKRQSEYSLSITLKHKEKPRSSAQGFLITMSPLERERRWISWYRVKCTRSYTFCMSCLIELSCLSVIQRPILTLRSRLLPLVAWLSGPASLKTRIPKRNVLVIGHISEGPLPTSSCIH